MGSLDTSKQLLRQHFKSARDTLTGEVKKKLDHKVCERTLSLIKSLTQPKRSIWTAYLPIQSEVDPSEVFKQTQSYIDWAFPVIQFGTMKFFVPHTETLFSKGSFGIQEPNVQNSKEMHSQDIHGCLVPGLAFDHHGDRLGYGKGYYDQFLKTFKGYSVGLAYDLQIMKGDLPKESTDVSVHYVVTESKVITCSESA